MSSPVEEAIKEIELESESSGESTDSESRTLTTVADSNVLVSHENKECTKFIPSIDLTERKWKKLLSGESLRPSYLWAHIDLNTKGTYFPKLKNLLTYALIRHCFELICGTHFLTHVSEVESKFASNSMSNIKPKILSAEEALARHRERVMASAKKKKQPKKLGSNAASQPVFDSYSCVSLKKKKVENEKDEKLEELEQRVAVLVANEDQYRMEQKAQVENLLG
ncbi:hypothetical protein ACOSQ4_004543 [Xanthoceras sorbifolium]